MIPDGFPRLQDGSFCSFAVKNNICSGWVRSLVKEHPKWSRYRIGRSEKQMTQERERELFRHFNLLAHYLVKLLGPWKVIKSMAFSDNLSHLMFILILRCFSLKFGFQIPKLASISMSVLKCHGCQLSNKSFDLRDSCRQIKTKCQGRKNI